MIHKEFEELVSSYIDFEVTPEEEKTIREHLSTCTSCRNLYEQSKIMKETLHELNEKIAIPPGLNNRLIKSLENVRKERPISKLFLILATSIVAIFILALFIRGYIFRTEANPLLNNVLESYRDISSGKLPIAYKSENNEDLQNDLDKTGNIPFEFDVDDFREMGFKLKGALVKDIAKRKSVIFIYEGKEQVGYYLLKSLESDFPKEAKKIRNSEKGVDFYLLQNEGYNLVMWKEENTTCIMVSKLDQKRLLDLAVDSIED
jgi:hypothetical protein